MTFPPQTRQNTQDIFFNTVLKIRLQRKGRKKRPFYRVVVAEHSSPVQGRFIEVVGHYNPLVTPKEVVFNAERIAYFLKNGAQPSETVARLGAKNGIAGFSEYVPARVMKPSNAEIEAKKQKEESERLAKEEAERAKAEAEAAKAAAAAAAEAEAAATETPEPASPTETPES